MNVLLLVKKTLREHFEAINHAKAIKIIEEMVENRVEMTEQNVRRIHAVILHDIDDHYAGRYRDVPVKSDIYFLNYFLI